MSQTGELNALYKVAYASGVENLIPTASRIQKDVKFVSSDLQNGKHYEQPVVLTAEAGFTYSLDTQNAYDLNDSIGMEMQSAIVPGADIVLGSTIGYNQAARASHSATSFKNVMGTKFENMHSSHEKRIDISCLHGQMGLAEAPVQTTSVVDDMVAVQISPSQWATGIWTGSENSQLVFSVASSNVAIDSLRSFRLAKVDVDAKVIYVAAGSAGTPGTLATLVTALGANALRINFYGAVSGSAGTFAYAEMAGLKRIMTNTGTLFGINAGIFDLWRGNHVTISGQLTMAKVLSAVSKAVQRGLDSDVTLYVNPNTWADLNSNLAALRRFDSSYSKSKASSGSKDIEYVSQNGTITIVSYNLVKEGEAFCFPLDKALRIGARELSFRDPTKKDSEEIFFTIPGKAGVGLRSYTNQAIFLEAPAQSVYIDGIVNSDSI